MNNFQSPNFSEKLFQVIANPIAADFAIKRLAIHRAAAEMQNRRIWEANSVLKANRPELSASASTWEAKIFIEDTQSIYNQLLFETHFYFVSWAKCGNMLRVLTGQNEFLEALKVYTKYKKDFDHYTEARNSFEHFEDRLPENKESAKMKEMTSDINAGPRKIYAGFEGTNYKYSNKTWDISSASVTHLNKAIDETLEKVCDQVEILFKSKFPT